MKGIQPDIDYYIMWSGYDNDYIFQVDSATLPDREANNMGPLIIEVEHRAHYQGDTGRPHQQPQDIETVTNGTAHQEVRINDYD